MPVYTVPARKPPTRQRRTKRTQGGFVLIVTSIAMTLLLGLAALAIDLGRMYVVRAELQSFTDAAALTAALELDGTSAGLDRARARAARLADGPHAMRWDLGTQPITHIETSFPSNSDGQRLARVVATEQAPVIFLRLFQSSSAATVAAASVAAKTAGSARLIQ